VLRLLAEAVRTANRMKVSAGVCGEMAGSVEGAAFLVGVGATSLSMSAGSLSKVADALAKLGLKGCKDVAKDALKAQHADSARAALSAAVLASPER
jgi:phosphotransferase system enzyme I (PtsI)